jgi:hypothetical protein
MKDYYYTVEYDLNGFDTRRVNHPDDIGTDEHGEFACDRLVHIQADDDKTAQHTFDQWMHIRNHIWENDNDKGHVFEQECTLYNNRAIIIRSYKIKVNHILWETCEVKNFHASLDKRRSRYLRNKHKRNLTRSFIVLSTLSIIFIGHYFNTTN